VGPFERRRRRRKTNSLKSRDVLLLPKVNKVIDTIHSFKEKTNKDKVFTKLARVIDPRVLKPSLSKKGRKSFEGRRRRTVCCAINMLIDVCVKNATFFLGMRIFKQLMLIRNHVVSEKGRYRLYVLMRNIRQSFNYYSSTYPP